MRQCFQKSRDFGGAILKVGEGGGSSHVFVFTLVKNDI